MFALGKLLEVLLSPSTLILVAVIASTVLLYTRHWRLGRTGLSVALCLAVVLTTLPVGWWLTRQLEDRIPPPNRSFDRIDGIILLGGTIQPDLSEGMGRPNLGPSASRMTEALALLTHHPEARLFFTGGSGNPLAPEQTEAPWAKDWFTNMGADMERIQFEGKSRNTRENAEFTKEIAKPHDGQTWVLITSAAHMPRAFGTFSQSGWRVTPWPVDYRTAPGHAYWLDMEAQRALITYAFHEWLGLVYYRLRGWTAEVFPHPSQQGVNE